MREDKQHILRAFTETLHMDSGWTMLLDILKQIS